MRPGRPPTNKEIARAMILKMIARADEILQKQTKPTEQEMKELRRLREAARYAKNLGV